MSLASGVVDSDQDILGGTHVFVGTRMSLRTLITHLEVSDSLDVSLGHFPSVIHARTITS
jgi:uncharacterized protein (DUF433 family)